MYASVCRDATYICVCVCVCLVCTVLYMRIEAYVFFEMPISIYVTVQCALVFAIFKQEDIVSLWNRTASDQVVTSRIRDTLTRVLSLPPNTIMEYKMHMNSIR